MHDDAVLLGLDHDSQKSVYVRLRDVIAKGLINGQITPGQKIPSIRLLAVHLDISQALVRKALDQLIAEGWLDVRHGSGTFVSQISPLLAGQSLNGQSRAEQFPTRQSLTEETRVEQTRAELSRAEQSQTEQSRVGPMLAAQSLKPDCCKVKDAELAQNVASLNAESSYSSYLSNPFSPSDWTGPFSKETIRQFTDATISGARVRAMIEAGRRSIPEICSGTKWENAIDLWVQDCHDKPLSLSEPAGLPELRECIATWLNQSRGMNCSTDNVIIMNNLAECQSFIGRLFIDKETAVLVEDPGTNALWLKAHNATLKPIAVDDSGLVAEEFEAVRDVPLAYVTPSAQLPTGAVLARPRRQRLLDWANRNRALIVEDDSNCEFKFDSRVIPSIHSMDDNDRTLYMGALEAVLPAQMQLAFVVVPRAVRAPFTRLKSIANRCTSPLLQRLVLRLLETEFVQERLGKLQRVLEQRRAILVTALAQIDQSNMLYSPAKSGTLQTVWLPPAFDDVSLAKLCSSADVLPISPCYLKPAGRPGLVLNFAQSPDTIAAYMQKLQTAFLSQSNQSDQEVGEK